jgi:hypothetical protein
LTSTRAAIRVAAAANRGEAAISRPRRGTSAARSHTDTVDVLPDVAEGTERLKRLAPFALSATVLDGPRVRVVDVGDTTPRVSLTPERLQELMRMALAPDDKKPTYVWVDGDSELALHAASTRVALLPGALLVGIRVECDQTGPVEVTVPFAIGQKDVAAGMVMSAPSRADGPATVVDRWGPVLVAAAYRAVLDVVAAGAATAGVDRDGRPLIPGAMTTDGETLSIVPQARHAIDRGRLL